VTYRGGGDELQRAARATMTQGVCLVAQRRRVVVVRQGAYTDAEQQAASKPAVVQRSGPARCNNNTDVRDRGRRAAHRRPVSASRLQLRLRSVQVRGSGAAREKGWARSRSRNGPRPGEVNGWVGGVASSARTYRSRLSGLDTGRQSKSRQSWRLGVPAL
jgi:hypothetical protein